MKKPRVFIASSKDGLDVTAAINVNLDRFAVFVLTPDDLIVMRGEENHVARDNVVFELGLFFGTLGKERCFLVKPQDTRLHLPTDLLGLSFAHYNANRSDSDLISAVDASCTLIENQIQALGLLSSKAEVRKEERCKISYSYKLGDVEHRLLAQLLEDFAAYPSGVSIFGAFESLRHLDKRRLSLAIFKLEKTGYLSKSIISRKNSPGENYDEYIYSLTENGHDYVLQNEHLVFGGSNYQVDTGSATETSPDDDIPF